MIFKYIKKLINELNAREVNSNFKQSPTLELSIKSIVPETLTRTDQLVKDENKAKNWSETEVENWFIKMNIKEFYEALKPLDGILLYQLYELKLYNPEFFYQLLSKSIKEAHMIDLKQAARFGACLVDLFKNNEK